MTMWRMVTAFALLLTTAVVHPLAAAPPDAALVVARTQDLAVLEEVAAALEAQGARLPHRFAEGLLVGSVPRGLERRFVAPAGVVVEFERPVGDPDAGPRLRSLPPIASAARLHLRGPRSVPSLPEPRPLGGDLIERTPEEIAQEAMQSLHFLPSDCDRPGATSAFLVGKVAIGIAIPESMGGASTEDWSNPDPRPAHALDDRRDLVVAEIMEGCDTLVSTMPTAGLSFYYDVHRDIPIDVEPINITVGQRSDWMAPALEAMGYGARAETSGVSGWLHVLRERFDTDWSAAAFIGDDLNDADNGYPPTGFPFAYALLGGPYMVMTYDNDRWSIDRMDVVFRHELGHIFNALDEYRSAGNSCAMQAGYLPTPNANNDSAPGDPDCLSSVPCVMRGNTTPDACAFTLGQIGVRDTDADGIVDVRDMPPSSSFNHPATLLLETDATALSGRVSGKGTSGESDSAPVTYFVNRVSAAEWSMDGSPWLPLLADDGAFGGRCEDVSIPLTGLTEGWHDVLLRGTNDVGILEPSPALVRLYVNTDCADDVSEPDDDSASAVGRPAGLAASLMHCAFDEDWSRFHLAAGASVGLTVIYDEALADLTVRLVDASGLELARGVGAAGIATLSTTALRTAAHFAVVEGAGEGESPYTLDISATCVDDAGEPDSTLATGQLRPPGTHRWLTLCPADSDHYLMSVDAGESVGATITFDPALGDLDLELIDPAGAIIGTSNGATGVESVATAATVEGVYAVRVFGKAATDSNVHELDLIATGCLDDAAENDDTALTARPVAPAVRGKICDADEDWMSFTITTPSLVRVQLSQDPAGCDLDLELRNAAGATLLGRGAPLGGVDDLTRERLMAGTYLLRVRCASGAAASVPYRLTFEAGDPLLLFVWKDPQDAILGWNDAGQECYLYRRSENPADFSGAVTAVVNEGDPSVPDGDHAIQDLNYRDRAVILDGRFLYCYLIEPRDCGLSLRASTKTADPYPVVDGGAGTGGTIEYTITVANDGSDDVFGAIVRDDIPFNVGSFTVLEIPPGATDSSMPGPAGASGRGIVVINGIDVPAGEFRIVRFRVSPDRSGIIEQPVISNQAQVQFGASPVTAPETIDTDDPATSLWGDETRVLAPGFSQVFRAHAFWHRNVDFDLRLIDTCGNVISEHDLTTATCGTNTMDVMRQHSCAFAANRYEAIWSRSSLPPGIYRVEIAYRASAEEDPLCTGRGVDEVTVALQTEAFTIIHRTFTMSPGDGPVTAFEFTKP